MTKCASIGTLALAVGLALGATAEAAAQDRRGGRPDDDELRDRRERVEELRRERLEELRRERLERSRLDRRRDRRVVDRHRDRDLLERLLRDRRGHRSHGARGGPAFCRSGAGHPVFGRRWCHRMGFGLGGFGHGDLLGRGGGFGLSDIFLGGDHRHRHRGFHQRRPLGHADLGALLGLALFDRLLFDVLGLSPWEARRITGRWHDTRRHDRRRAAWWQRGHRPVRGADALALQLLLDGERVAELADLDRDGRVDLLLTSR